MYLRLLPLLLAAVLLTGCSVSCPAQPAGAPANSQSAAPAQTIPAAYPTVPAPAITGEEARNIALAHASFTENQVSFLRVEYEIDDGIGQYDVSFREGRWEYEYEIHAQTGAILSFEKDD